MTLGQETENDDLVERLLSDSTNEIEKALALDIEIGEEFVSIVKIDTAADEVEVPEKHPLEIPVAPEKPKKKYEKVPIILEKFLDFYVASCVKQKYSGGTENVIRNGVREREREKQWKCNL